MGLGATQMHDAAIDAGLVETPEPPPTHDQMQADAAETRRSERENALNSLSLDDVEALSADEFSDDDIDAEMWERLRENKRAELEKRDVPTHNQISGARSSLVRDLTETEFSDYVLTSSRHSWSLLLLHRGSAACKHVSQLLDSLSREHPSISCSRLLAKEGVIARFPLSACPTLLAYRDGEKRLQFDTVRLGGVKATYELFEDLLVDAGIID